LAKKAAGYKFRCLAAEGIIGRQGPGEAPRETNGKKNPGRINLTRPNLDRRCPPRKTRAQIALSLERPKVAVKTKERECPLHSGGVEFRETETDMKKCGGRVGNVDQPRPTRTFHSERRMRGHAKQGQQRFGSGPRAELKGGTNNTQTTGSREFLGN